METHLIRRALKRSASACAMVVGAWPGGIEGMQPVPKSTFGTMRFSDDSSSVSFAGSTDALRSTGGGLGIVSYVAISARTPDTHVVPPILITVLPLEYVRESMLIDGCLNSEGVRPFGRVFWLLMVSRR